MEWAIGIPILLLLLACPLMMVGMVAFGWLFGRRFMGGHGANSHGGHGMMMCMGHGSRDTRQETRDTAAPAADLLGELKAERERLDELIARTEGGR